MGAEHPAAEPPVRTSLRLVWLVGLVYVVAAATHPGSAGRHLAGLVLTVTTALGWAGWLWARYRMNQAASLAAIGVLAVSGGVLVVLGPIGVVVIGVAGLCAASLLDVALAVAITAPGVVASAVAVAVTGHSAASIGGAASGAAAGLAVGMGRRQAQERVRQEAALEVAHQRSELEHDRAEVFAERNRIAREVHDVLAHTLSALSVQMEAVGSLLDDGATAGEVSDAVARSRRLVTEGLEETRRAVRVLRDEPVDVADQVAGFAGDEVIFGLDGRPRPLPPAAGLALVRIAQEAVTNARKHAPGVPVTLTLTFGDDVTALTVENDLTTTTSSLAATGAGFGLQGMRERIELAGGTLSAGPCSGRWQVRAEVPS